MVAGLFDNGAMPVLERVAQFTQQRHRALTHNIANLSTPFYHPRDLDPESFQATLRDAVDRRRAGANPVAGPLRPRDTAELRFQNDRLDAQPRPTHEGILFHDQNNRDLERTMQHLAENTLTHNTAIELLRNEYAMLALAIRERP